MRLAWYGRFAAAALGATAALGLAACSGSSDDPKPPPSISKSSPETTAKRTESGPVPAMSSGQTPEQAAAVRAYLDFVRATNEAEIAPKNAKLVALSPFAVDPALGQAADLISQLQVFKYAYRGVPPKPRVKVIGKPDATAQVLKLENCPTVAPDWQIYSTTTGKPARQVANKSSASPPYAISVTVRKTGDKWKVATTTLDPTRTCEP